MKITCHFPETLNPALRGYTQDVLSGVIRGVGDLPCDIQKLIEWIGVSYEGNPPLLVGHFRLEAKLGFVVCHVAVPASAVFNVNVYGEGLVLRVAKEFRTQVLLMIQQHVQQINQAVLKTSQLLA